MDEKAIYLDLEEYCQDGQCRIFEPEVSKMIACHDGKWFCSIRIQCKYRDGCESVCEYFKKRSKEKRLKGD